MPTPDSYYTKAELALIKHPETLDAICGHVGAGGALEDLCRGWHQSAAKAGGSVRFGAIWRWICEDRDRFKRWLESNNLQAQADVSRADALLRSIAFADVRNLFDDQGRVLPPDQWPADLAALVTGLDVAELFGKGEGKEAVLEGLLKKVKLADRIKAAEIILKRNSALVERKEVSGTLKLEDLVSRASTED